jgi:integrase
MYGIDAEETAEVLGQDPGHQPAADLIRQMAARIADLEAKEGALTDHVIEWDGLPVKKIRKAFAAAVERAGLGTYEPDPTRPGKQRFVTDVTPHTLRHTAISWAEEEGMDMGLISRLAAHGGPDITRRVYSKPSVDALRPVAAAINRRLLPRLKPVEDGQSDNPET